MHDSRCDLLNALERYTNRNCRLDLGRGHRMLLVFLVQVICQQGNPHRESRGFGVKSRLTGKPEVIPSTVRPSSSMRRPVSVKTVLFFYQVLFALSQAASVAILPSALFVSDVRSVPVGCSRFSGAATCESTSLPTFSAGVGPQDLVAVTWTRRLSSALRTRFYATVLTPSQC